MEKSSKQDAELKKNPFIDAKVFYTKISDAEISDAKVSDAKISDAKVSDAEFSDAKIKDAILRSKSFIPMAIKLSLTIGGSMLLIFFLMLNPGGVEVRSAKLNNGMKFKRICYLSLDLPPYGMKALGPTTRNVPANQAPSNGRQSFQANSTLWTSLNNFSLFDAPSGDPVFDPKYCTHINIIPAHFDANGRVFPASPGDVSKYKEINALRTFNPSLKILISMCSENAIWGKVVSSNETRTKFVANLIRFINIHGFDGVDFDWEFPVYSSFRFNERLNFVSLLRDVRNALDADSEINSHFLDRSKIINRGNLLSSQENWRHKSKRLLTIDVPGDVTIVLPGYNVIEINSIVDWINLMTYDLRVYKPFYPFTGFNGATYPKKNQGYYFSTLNVASAAYLWHNLGMDKDKIVIGVPTYARSYILFLPSLNYVGAPALREGNLYSFGDVCDILMKNGTVKVFDDEAMVPFAYNDDLWISYEDAQSATEKAKFIKAHKFGGAMTFSLNSDDFDGRCDKVKKAGLMGGGGVSDEDTADEGGASDEVGGVENGNVKFMIQRALYNVLK